MISRKGARMDLTNVVIAIVVVLLVLSFRWFLRKFCDTLNWNTRFTSHTSDSNTTTINSSPQIRTVYTIEVNSVKTKESKAHSLSKKFCAMIPFSKNDSWCQLWPGWKGLVRMILFQKMKIMQNCLLNEWILMNIYSSKYSLINMRQLQILFNLTKTWQGIVCWSSWIYPFLPVLACCRAVANGGGGFGQTVNPISTRRADYTHHNTTSTPGFSDLATGLCCDHKIVSFWSAEQFYDHILQVLVKTGKFS